MKLRLARHSIGNAVVVAVEGELDLFTAPFLRDEVRDAIKQDGARLVLDLHALSFMDSSGLSLLVRYWKLACAAGGTLRLVAPPPHVVRKLDTTGLSQRLQPFPGIPEMMKAPLSAEGHHGRRETT